MKTAMVLGGASCVWEDAAAALDLFTPDAVAAANDIGTRWAGRIDFFCTLHHEKMAIWRRRRIENGLKPAGRYIGTSENSGVDEVVGYLWPGMTGSGSSGLYAVKVLIDRGFDRIVLAGVPMDGDAAHFFSRARWDEVSAYSGVWTEQRGRLQGVVKSMSGFTRELLGAPTTDWLRGNE